jgi:hypothetical protein
MRFLKMMAVAGFAVGLTAFTSQAQMAMGGTSTIGVGAQSGALYNGDYHLGYGVAGSVGGAMGLGELDIRANYLNYQSMNAAVSDRNEGGVGLAALIGPTTTYVQPKVGGHVGYTRFSSGNFLDVGPDVAALFKLNPKVGIQAAVTPTWLINQAGNDYRTRASIGVQWTPGA